MADPNPIDDKALDSLAVAPDDSGDERAIQDPRQEAGQDASIGARLQRDPGSAEARLDNALDESMDASDPPSSTQPVHNHEPAASSGYNEDEERQRQKDMTMADENDWDANKAAKEAGAGTGGDGGGKGGAGTGKGGDAASKAGGVGDDAEWEANKAAKEAGAGGDGGSAM